MSLECGFAAPIYSRIGFNLQSSRHVSLERRLFYVCSGTCKKHQRKIVRCIKHARSAGLIPFQLTPTDYEMYDAMVGGKKSKSSSEQVAEEVEEEGEGSLSDVLNKAEEEAENDQAEKTEKEGDNDMSSEDFVKLMNLLSAEEKDERDEA